jgi:superfamily II DNA or RNA helicase
VEVLMSVWAGAQDEIGRLVALETERCLNAYRAKPNLVEQDAGIEISNVEGGYGRKQLHEIIQNGADAMRRSGGRISVVLTADHLYCANEGDPLTPRGVEALMASHLSTKRDDQIGRFGLGFKSVLGISDAPEIFSRSGSVRFDRGRARELITGVVPGARRTPVLRVALAVDPGTASAVDPVLEELMDWATTIVRLPLRAGTDWISEDLERFPPEFLLFADHVSTLEFDNRRISRRRVWTARRLGSAVVISTEGREMGWNVFRGEHRPSAAARADAGEIAGRERVDLAWAVPAKGRSAAGQFWAYFPTASRTTLSGIVNAPFKTTEDRHDILDGVYNRELLEQLLPKLVSSALPELVDPDDPCSLFEVLPARGREARSWADDVLNEPVVNAVASTRCIPDQDGNLGMVSEVALTPRFVSDHPRWADMWASVPSAPKDWIHPSVDQTAERRAKASRLYDARGLTEATTQQWLNALASSETRGSMVAIQLANLINKSEPDEIVAVRRATVVLRIDGRLVAPAPGKIFLPDAGTRPSEPQFVAMALAEDKDTLDALVELGITPLDGLGRLQAQIQRMAPAASKGADVERLWALARAIPRDQAVKALEQGFGRGGTPVRTVAARVARLHACLLPGTVVPADGSRDATIAIDLRFHATDHDLLADLGAVAGPRLAAPTADEKWFAEWRSYARDVYLAAARGEGARVAPASVAFRHGRTATRLDVLPELSVDGRVAFTQEVLRLATEEWTVYAEARSAAGQIRTLNPGVWWIRRHGAVQTPFGPCPVSEAVAPAADVRTDILPVPAGLQAAEMGILGLRPPRATADWERVVRLGEKHLKAGALVALYAAAARADCPRPEELEVPGRGPYKVFSDRVLVTADPVAYELLKGIHDVLLADDPRDAQILSEVWQLSDARKLLNRTVLHAASGEIVALIDKFPGLRVTAARPVDLDLLPCSELAVEVTSADDRAAGSVKDCRTLLDDGIFYFRDTLTAEELLEAVNAEVRLGLDATRLRQTVEIGRRQETNQHVRKVRAAESVEEKLIALAGEDEIRKLVPQDAIRIAESRRGRALKPAEIAKMAGRAVGGQIIQKLTPAIEKRGITVPSRFNGGTSATAFARELGLPTEFAGSRENQRPEKEVVPGPVRLPLLHNYQVATIESVRRMLRPGGPMRGLVALPTGSGKTRVAVEALIDHVREENADALIIWIAQTDELCEQAVDSWCYLWRAIGTHETNLTVNRLWGSNSAARVESGAQVVVATDDKLLSAARRGGYEWLQSATVVVVDEAHTSVSKTYTELFNWLGRGARDRDRPLLGLSATPYRGTNEEQTKLLVNRYDQNLLTDGLFGDANPHAVLQQMGILARVRHEVLEGIELKPVLPSRPEPADRFALLETRIDLQQVAKSEDRNARILDSLEKLDTGVTALVFAASVQHAEQLAAVLDVEGVPAAAISAYTPPSERRERIQQFHAGRIRVLTNYNVLSQGFDAPRVGAVYVVRPTFSPNRYQQMIGRGLRGPRNGGSEEVLIVNVQDNIDAFGEQLAFHHFDELWREPA